MTRDPALQSLTAMKRGGLDQLTTTYLAAVFLYLLLLIVGVLSENRALIMPLIACFLGLLHIATAMLYHQLAQSQDAMLRRLEILESRMSSHYSQKGADTVKTLFDRELRQSMRQDPPGDE